MISQKFIRMVILLDQLLIIFDHLYISYPGFFFKKSELLLPLTVDSRYTLNSAVQFLNDNKQFLYHQIMFWPPVCVQSSLMCTFFINLHIYLRTVHRYSEQPSLLFQHETSFSQEVIWAYLITYSKLIKMIKQVCVEVFFEIQVLKKSCGYLKIWNLRFMTCFRSHFKSQMREICRYAYCYNRNLNSVFHISINVEVFWENYGQMSLLNLFSFSLSKLSIFWHISIVSFSIVKIE